MSFLNSGFEQPLDQGWEALGSATRVAVDSSFSGATGSYYANLESSGATKSDIELFLGLSSGSLASKYTNGSAIRQIIEVASGQKLWFDWKFFDNEGDSTSYDDASFVVRGSASELLSSVSISGATQEGRYEYMFDTAGEYTVGVAVLNAEDQAVNAVLKVDNFALDGAGSDHTSNKIPTTE